MSDNIPPLDIQMEIIKYVSDPKSLIQFRSVSKQWKSFIDSSEFFKGYGDRHTQPLSNILSYKDEVWHDNYISFVDDNIEPFMVQQQQGQFVVSSFLKKFDMRKVVGVCEGLLCLYGLHRGDGKMIFVIWNPSIGKSVGIHALWLTSRHSGYALAFGFGVCPIGKDPSIVTFISSGWEIRAMVFTLSSGVWNVIPLHQSIDDIDSTQSVVIDNLIYWGAHRMDPKKICVLSLDLVSKEFEVINLPDHIIDEVPLSKILVSNLRGSLAVYGFMYVDQARYCSVWVMDHNSSFRKLFKIGAPLAKILGSLKNGETIFENEDEEEYFTTIDVYDPSSQQIKNLGISGRSFFMGSYTKSLLLLDQLDSHIYHDINPSK